MAGHISYPRTTGANEDRRRLKTILAKISSQLDKPEITAQDLLVVQAIIARIGLKSLTPKEKQQLFRALNDQLLHSAAKQNKARKNSAKKKKIREAIFKLRQQAFDIAVSSSDSSSSLLHERLNEAGHYDLMSLASPIRGVDLFRVVNGGLVAFVSDQDSAYHTEMTSCFRDLHRALERADTELASEIKSAYMNDSLTVMNLAGEGSGIFIGDKEGSKLENITVEQLNCQSIRSHVFESLGEIVGTYNELKNIDKPGYQREHPLVHSCFTLRPRKPGEKRSDVPINPLFGDYSEGLAITYFVYDGQTKNTEHQVLTQKQREYAKELHAKNQHATVNDWLDVMERATAETLALTTIERAPNVFKARAVGDDALKLARALRLEYEAQLDRLGVDKNSKMANHIGNGDAYQIHSEEEGTKETNDF